MQRPVNQNPQARPVHDTERYRSADHGTRPVGASANTRRSAHYDIEVELPVTGAMILEAAGVKPKGRK